MSSYFARYKSGECDAVFRELLSYGKNLYGSSLLSDAVDVARELVDRSFNNLSMLVKRLRDLGYWFDHAEDVLAEAGHDDVAALDAVESSAGALPIIARKWYERIKSVDFSQEERQLFSKDGVPCSPVSGLGLNTPLVFLSIPKCLLLQTQVCENAASDGDDPQRFTRFLPLGSWASNSEPKGFWLPCESFDGELYNEGAGGVHFVDELRTAFKWGGFPVWQRLLTGKKQAQPLRCVPTFETVLPILTEGLSPI